MSSMYDRDAVRFMWEELAETGIAPLTSAQEVDAQLSQKTGTQLLVINSVCGCSAGYARPGVMLALQNGRIPDRLNTVFAGVDTEATARAREHMAPMPPSSPSVALFKDGELVFMLHRRDIEGSNAQEVSDLLRETFDQYCTKPGPSVPRETLMRVLERSLGPACGTTFKL